MNWDSVDWSSLERLRRLFLSPNATAADYWRSDADLVSYDQTFAQRIGWKWDWVLEDLSRLGWQPPSGSLLDWGCGTGIAHRSVFHHFGVDSTNRLHVWDRSAMAMRYAARVASKRYPRLPVESHPCDSPALLLLSHVLTELSADQATRVVDLAGNAEVVLWVEPGTYEASLALIAVRERLRSRMNVVAPCTHQRQCGLLAPGNERHWCHHFATPPNEVFTDGNWARFGKMMGIDLRSLPLSYLVMDKRPARVAPGATRIIGRPRIYKSHALILGCNSSGVAEHRLEKRPFPEAYRKLRKNRSESIHHWTSENGVIKTLM